jgi:crossover junction endodeoxyribonuclease RusA
MTFVVRVEGDPVSQGSKRCFCRNGRATLIEASDKLKPWRARITAAAIYARVEQRIEPLDVPVGCYLTFYMPRPASAKREVPSVKPDIDKLTRAVLDALTDADIWTDDSRVVSLYALKVYATDVEKPGVRIEVKAL